MVLFCRRSAGLFFHSHASLRLVVLGHGAVVRVVQAVPVLVDQSLSTVRLIASRAHWRGVGIVLTAVDVDRRCD